MTSYTIHSVTDKNNVLMVSPLPSSDIYVASWASGEGYDAAHLRIKGMSRFDVWMKNCHPQNFFLGMAKFNADYNFPLANNINVSVDFEGKKNAEVVTFPDDANDALVSVIKTEDNIFGIQTFSENWQDFRKQVTPVWLGRSDLDTKASELLNMFFKECLSLHDQWQIRDKPSDHRHVSLAALINPEIQL